MYATFLSCYFLTSPRPTQINKREEASSRFLIQEHHQESGGFVFLKEENVTEMSHVLLKVRDSNAS
jgi:hypothetical protein